MKILSADQIRALDKYTIQHEPITSVDLMERAAKAFFKAVKGSIEKEQKVYVFCGMGNNGGDGLAVARLLLNDGYSNVHCYVAKLSETGSLDFESNLGRLNSLTEVKFINSKNKLPNIGADAVVIDALFGTGLSRPVEGVGAGIIQAINRSGATVYSIDIPSGLYADKPNGKKDVVVQANTTYTFQSPKLSFMYADNGKYVNDFKVLDIGLSTEFIGKAKSKLEYLQAADIKTLLKKRTKFSHKGTYGHALIMAGSYGKVGAAVLSVRAALHSGAGLVSAAIPKCGYEIMQISNPEAMVLADTEEKMLTQQQDYGKFSVIGIGPGIGTENKTVDLVGALLKQAKQPLVIDADALNIIPDNKRLQKLLPEGSILTPHPGEFKRLAGEWKDDEDKLKKQLAFSKKHKVVIVLKGANTSISTPDGKIYFNSTGNPGMAKGGSGDVLTGIITSLVAQKYSAEHAAVIGVYIHGLAGDMAAKKMGETGITALDIIKYLPKAFKQFE